MLAALIATAALAEGDLQAQAQPGHGAPAAAAAQTPPPAAAPTAPAAGEAAGQPAHPSPAPVEAPHGAPAPVPAPGDHAAPAAPAAGSHGAASAHGPPAQGDHAAQAGAGHGAAQGSGHGGGGAHDEGIMPVVYRLLNFAILAGGLYYFLNKPVREYFASRGQQIRGGLIAARETSERATAQLAELDRRLQALPAEIEAVRAKGVKEIAAEEARIQAQAEAERKRLIDDVQRDIDVRVRVARKQLAEDAADLAVKLAADRVRSTITDAEQARLIDRYATQVKDIHG